MDNIDHFLRHIPIKHRRYVKFAYIAALSSPGTKHGNYRHGAVIMNGNKLCSVKHNSGKSHPKLFRRTIFPYLHAEQNVIFHLGIDNCKGKVLYVIRVTYNGKLGMSLPCKTCMTLIKEVGFKKVYYSNERGEIVELCLG